MSRWTGPPPDIIVTTLTNAETLEQAEIRLGTPFTNGLLTDIRAKTWGLFDGFKGRPMILPKGHEQAYELGYKEGADLYMRELPA